MGHYLGALAFLGNHTGNEAILGRSQRLLDELRRVQEALGEGYLSAFPKDHFARLRRLEPVWAPFYVVRIEDLAGSAVQAALGRLHIYAHSALHCLISATPPFSCSTAAWLSRCLGVYAACTDHE